MKTSNSKPLQTPHLTLATMTEIQSLPIMRTRLAILKLFIILCGFFVTTAVFGQSTFIWTNSAGGDLATAANWNPNGTPTPNDGGTGDTMEFDGQSSGPVLATSNTGSQTGSSGGTLGLKVYLTANQTNPVTFYTTIANAASSGIRFSDVTLDSGAGSLIFGNANSTTNSLDTLWGGTSGQIHTWINNSTNPIIITPNFRMRYGGGGTHTHFFQGTGDFYVTNDMITANSSGTIMAKTGSGKLVWTAGKNPYSAENSSIVGPVTLNGGTLILKSATLLSAVTTPLTFQNSDGSQATLLVWDVGAGVAGTINLTISGYIPLQVNSGTLTLSAAGNSFYGNILLSGGELIAGATDNGSSGPLGSGNTITFSGGTLGFSPVNTHDYSAQFDTSANQAYSFDTAGQNVTFATALASTGGTLKKLGSGTLTLSGANTYSGLTAVGVGKLLLQNTSGSGSIIISNSATLGVTGGSQITPASLTVGTTGNAILEFNNVTSTGTPLIAVAGAISVGGPITINVNGGTFAVNQNYPLFSWGSGAAPGVTLGTVVGAVGNLVTNGSSIQLHVTALSDKWSGSNNGNWDTSTANNWTRNGSPLVFANGDAALFDDTATGTTTITVNGVVISPAGVTVNNTVLPYSIATASGSNIGGSGNFTKTGTNILTLSGGANTYTGITTINNGVLSVGTLANGGSASDIGSAANAAANLVINGGLLQYTGSGASSDHLFTLGTAGGTVDNEGTGALILNNAGAIGLSGTGPRTLTLTGIEADTNTFAATLSDNGGATTLAKNGSGLWVLSGNNTYSGVTTIANGTLQIGTGGTSGSLGVGNVVNNNSLTFNRSDSLTNNGVISGSGSVTLNGSGTIVLAANDTYAGGTTINAGTLQIGDGVNGSLSDHPIVNNGLLVLNSATPTTLSGFNSIISGTGNVIVHSGVLRAYAGPGNTYTGWTQIDPGATFQFIDGNSGASFSSSITNNGTLYFTAQESYPAVRGYSNNIVGIGRVLKDNNNANAGWVVLAGTNTYTGGTFIGGGGIQLGDGINTNAGTIVGNVVFTNTGGANFNPRILVFNHPENYTFPGNIISVVTDSSVGASGSLEQDGSNTLTLTGNNTYPGGTTISNGVIQVGAGGTTGWIGSGAINIGNPLSTIVFDRSDSVTFTNAITGPGSLVQAGPGTLALTGLSLGGTNTYYGPTIVSNGTLVVTGGMLGGDLDVNGGTVMPAATGTIGTLIVSNNMNITSGTISIALNKTLSPSNSLFVVSNTINATGGTLSLVSYGGTLAVGDKFYVFNKAVSGGGSMTITSPNATFANNLATDGSVTVTTVTPPSGGQTISFSLSGSQLTLSWPTSGVHVQSQTNSLSTGLGTNWVTIPGTDAGTNYSTTVDKTKGSIFYRLAP